MENALLHIPFAGVVISIILFLIKNPGAPVMLVMTNLVWFTNSKKIISGGIEFQYMLHISIALFSLVICLFWTKNYKNKKNEHYQSGVFGVIMSLTQLGVLIYARSQGF